MALGSSRFGTIEGAQNAVARDFVADTVKAVKARIAEYKTHGRDTSDLEDKLEKVLGHAKDRPKRKAKNPDDPSDGRDDSDKGDTEEAQRREEENVEAEHPKGVPDQLIDKSPDPVADAGKTPDVPDQVSPWPKREVEHAIAQPPLPKSNKAAKPGSAPSTKTDTAPKTDSASK